MRHPPFLASILQPALALAMTGALLYGPPVQAATPAELLAHYSAQAGRSPLPAQGQQFFTTRHAGEWSCASCHQASALQPGRHATTGKPIQPLAPAAHPARFTDLAKAEKWFRRNCQDVARRACTPGEKADVLAWLMSLKP